MAKYMRLCDLSYCLHSRLQDWIAETMFVLLETAEIIFAL